MTRILTIAIIFTATWINAFGSAYLKIAAEKFDMNLIKQLKNKPLIKGAFLFGISTVLYLLALHIENLSIVYPLTSLSYIWVAFLSYKKFGESIHLKKMLGIALIIAGIALINLS